ncbi:hypothetical protein [Roseibium sediminicola]|uniref:Uncharacterized protein n=1 Tax=Roseibium sediminicola TaxID=2933272 RepID=A0ABT0GPD6_9HYPH|nr:hypothetical protein [Roseibium sp. CAU 1639]MCK7611300.1 hypothetical protein [Roseibium sp. CAU 1639]
MGNDQLERLPMLENEGSSEPPKKVMLSAGNARAELSSEDIQLLETAVEMLIYSDLGDGEQARDMRHTGKELHALMERLSTLLEV